MFWFLVPCNFLFNFPRYLWLPLSKLPTICSITRMKVIDVLWLATWFLSFLVLCLHISSIFWIYIFKIYNRHASYIVGWCVNILSVVALHCSGNSSMGLPDKIHWVGTFLLLSEDHTILTAYIAECLSYGDSLFNDALSLSPPTLISRSLAEFSRIPVVVTNQVRSQSRDETCHYFFQGWMT